jgi:hypothetical protein
VHLLLVSLSSYVDEWVGGVTNIVFTHFLVFVLLLGAKNATRGYLLRYMYGGGLVYIYVSLCMDIYIYIWIYIYIYGYIYMDIYIYIYKWIYIYKYMDTIDYVSHSPSFS